MLVKTSLAAFNGGGTLVNDRSTIHQVRAHVFEPPLAEPPMVSHVIFLPDGLYEWTQAVGRIRGLGASAIVRLALVDYLERTTA